VLCVLSGRSREEAARELGWSEGAVKGRLERARRLLRERLLRRGVASALPAVLTADLPVGRAAEVARLGSAFASGRGASGTAVHLAEGVLRTMSFARWKVALTLALLLGAGVGLTAVPGSGGPSVLGRGGTALRWPRVAADPEPPKPLEWTHKGGVHALAWSGGLIATAGQDKVVRLWDARTGKQVATLEGHDRPVRAVAFSPDGKVLASGDEQGRLRLWDTGVRRILSLTVTPLVSVRWLAFSPDGTILAAAGMTSSAMLYDVPSGKLNQTLKGAMKEVIHAAAFAPDGKQIVLGGLVTLNEGTHWSTFHLRDVATGKELLSSEGPRQPANALPANAGRSYPVVFGPDGKAWAGAACEHTINLWRTGLIMGHKKPITGLAFTPDGKRLVSAGLDGLISVTEVGTAKELARLTGQGAIVGLALSPDGKKLAWATAAGVVKVRALATLPAAGKKD
jgi:WD40 repeat protein